VTGLGTSPVLKQIAQEELLRAGETALHYPVLLENEGALSETPDQ
jgi:hypothetical protein